MRSLPLALFFSFICLLLGLWQWQRLEWKENLLEQIKTKCQTGSFLPLPPQKKWSTLDKNLWSWQRIQFSAKQEKHAAWLWRAGKRAKLNLVKLEKGYILVWQASPSTSPNALKPRQGQGNYQAVLYPNQERRFYDVQDDVKNKIYYVRNIEKIAATLDAATLDAARLDLDGPLFPLMAELSLQCPAPNNHHFGYMMTWFSLMLLLPIAAIFGRKEE
jgi:surfeit locus 1 family protein